MGAILTQSTSWKNVEKSLSSLWEAGITSPEKLLASRRLAQLIRSSGYYNQKALKLKAFANAVQSFGGIENFLQNVPREELLGIHGIGPETADSILLYAARRPHFVVDAYTRRLFGGRFFPKDAPYEKVRELFESNLPRDYKIYNEFHALIVAKGKNGSEKQIKNNANNFLWKKRSLQEKI